MIGFYSRAQKEPKVPPAPGYEYNWQNLSKLTAYILALWAFCAGVYAILLYITTGIRDAPFRHLPLKYLGKFSYANKDGTIVTPTTQPKLMPWVRSIMCSGAQANADNNTCVPNGTPSSSNPIGYIERACNTLCTNS